jgi:regulatory protein
MNRKITALKAQKRNHQRVNVYLDGEYAFSLARIVAAWLQVGGELSEEKIASLQAEDDRETAFQRAVKFIGYRMRSEKEIRDKLEEYQIPEGAITRVMDRLRRSGLVNDTQFSQIWVENRAEYRPRSHRALAYELRRKGIPDELIEQTLEETEDDEELAYRAAKQHSRKWNELEWPDFRKKLSGFLARRGFSYHIAAQVVGRVWAERESGESFE